MDRFDDVVTADSVWIFKSPLRFLEQDVSQFPWLNEKHRHYRVVRRLSSGGFSVAFLARPCSALGDVLSDDQVVVKFPHLDTSGRFSRA